MSQTQPRQNFNSEAEAGINKQINVELHASYIYQSMVNTKIRTEQNRIFIGLNLKSIYKGLLPK
jgi:hypothetical protein